MLRVQDHQAGPTPVHDEIRAYVSRNDYLVPKTGHAASANGRITGGFEAKAVLRRTSRTGIFLKEAVKQRLSTGLPVRVRRPFHQIEIQQLMQDLGNPRLGDPSLHGERRRARPLSLAIDQPDESADDREAPRATRQGSPPGCWPPGSSPLA